MRLSHAPTSWPLPRPKLSRARASRRRPSLPPSSALLAQGTAWTCAARLRGRAACAVNGELNRLLAFLSRGPLQRTPLMAAAARGDTARVRFLAELAGPLGGEERFSRPADRARVLAARFAKIDAPDALGRTALAHAAAHDCVATVQELLRFGAAPDPPVRVESTPLHVTMSTGVAAALLAALRTAAPDGDVAILRAFDNLTPVVALGDRQWKNPYVASILTESDDADLVVRGLDALMKMYTSLCEDVTDDEFPDIVREGVRKALKRTLTAFKDIFTETLDRVANAAPRLTAEPHARVLMRAIRTFHEIRTFGFDSSRYPDLSPRLLGGCWWTCSARASQLLGEHCPPRARFEAEGA